MAFTQQHRLRILAGLGLIVLAGCTSPTGTTKDSFEMTSSTSGRTWFSADGTVADNEKVAAFATLNFTVLKVDMARGEGEYLGSLGTLIGVPEARRLEFQALVQDRYLTLVPSQRTTAADMLASLADVMTGF